MNNVVNAEVDNNQLSLYIDPKDRPAGTHKVGTVPVILRPGQERTLVQVAGHMRVYNNKRDRAAFEQELRQLIERPYVLHQLFGDMGDNPSTKKLNPSIRTRAQNGWLRPGETQKASGR